MAKNSLLNVALRTTALTVLGIALASPEAGASNRSIGVASGTTTEALGTPPNEDTRVLSTGTTMFFEEKVSTDDTGRAQLLFEDGSSMTVGPKSDLVIDRFVYDPDARTGDMAVSLTKGIVRFVGGRISKKRAVQFKTPVGTMGIRGGIAVISVEPAGGIEVDFLFGREMTLEVNGTVQTTTTPGTFISVSAPGAAPSEPQRRAPEALNQRLQAFEAGATEVAAADDATPESADRDAAPSRGQTLGQRAQERSVSAGNSGQQQTAGSNVGTRSGLTREIESGAERLATLERQQQQQVAVRVEGVTGVPVGERLRQDAENLDLPPPRPEQDRPQDFIAVAPAPAPTVEPTPVAPAPTQPVTPPPVVVVDTPTDTGSTPSPVSFSRTYSGFAFRGGASFATVGADTTNSNTALGNRRFSSATASGSDQGVGGQVTASTTAGAYKLFYPGPTTSSPTQLSACPTSLDCSTQIAGVTPSSVDGPINHAGDPDFVSYTLNVDGQKELVFFGKPYTGAVPTGATTYKLLRDPFFTDSLPFARTPVSGLASNKEPAGTIYWGSSATEKPFVSSSFEYNASGGTSIGSVVIGRVNVGGSTEYFSGFAYGMSDTASTDAPQFYKGGAFSADDGAGKDFFGSNGPDNFVLSTIEDADTSNSVPAGMDDKTGVGTTYYPVSTVQKTGTVTVSGSDRTFPSNTVTGFTAGAGTVAGTPEAFRTTSATGNTSLLTVSSSADTVDVSVAVTGSGGTTITSTTNGSVSAYITDKTFASQMTGGTISAGSEANIEGVFATHGSNSASFDLCSSCQFLKWGYWGLRMSDQNATLHMASWVAGVATTVGTLSGVTSGSATYTGNVIGTVIENGATALKTGTFSTGISFSGSTATVTLNSLGFDGNTFNTATTTFNNSSVNGFAMTDTSSVAGKTLDMRGALFGTDGTNPPPELGGDFRITGTGYNAAGVFGGKK
ncbi:FecR domain-containing protein [Nisaea sediminum]|uniref:FecR domain-containing protein n=1 Tax=Nisaea sediminum TaxID=2775867 RepID=UPI0018664DA7|nr:FecR domain-containing protein [Nisaea sediminum]